LAEQPLRRVLAEAPGFANAQFLYGIACQMRGDNVTAAEYMRKAAKQRPDDPNILTNLGGALYDSGATEEAFVYLRRATELAPMHASTWYNLGKALKLHWQLDEAADALRRALIWTNGISQHATRLRTFSRYAATFPMQWPNTAKCWPCSPTMRRPGMDWPI
jgi:Tfp pilus assembly protein PilF